MNTRTVNERTSIRSSTVTALLRSVSALVLGTLTLFSMQFPPEPAQFRLDGRLNCPVIATNGGTAYLQLTITAPPVLSRHPRKPMNLSVVIDRSGSMGDQRKMDYAKKAFASLISQLQPEDILSLVVYDDEVTLLRSASPLGKKKTQVQRILDEVQPRGSTNLGGGLEKGLQEAERFAGRGYINRVVLLSDGLANVGVTDPAQLNLMVRKYRSRSIAVTAMGVGLDYNENLMMALAESGGGNYYFIEHPNLLASIVRDEFAIVASVLAQNAAVHLSLGDGVTVTDILGCEFQRTNGTLVIPVGDLAADETREYTVQLMLPPGSGRRQIASGTLRYERPGMNGSYPSFTALVTYSADVAEVERNRDLQTQAQVDIARSAVKVEEAMKAMDSGDRAMAEQQLNEAKVLMSSSPAATAGSAGAASVQDQLGRIESYERTAKEETDTRRAKKSIQYDNYKVRKKR